MTSTRDVAQQLAALRAEYARQLPDKLTELYATLAALKLQYDRGQVEILHRQTHMLTGSGATYGFPRLSETARILEQRIKAHLTQAHEASPDELTEWGRLLYSVAESAGDMPASTPAIPALPSVQAAPDKEAFQIYVLDDDSAVGNQLTDQLRYFGYQASAFQTPEALALALRHARPDAIIVDVVLQDGATGPSVAQALAPELPGLIPIIFISERDDLSARLQSVRAGGTGFFPKPVNIDLLVDHLDRLIQHTQPEPFRVLIVEDAVPLAELYATTLESVDMITHTVSEPMRVLEAIQDFNPELILMDMYMPAVRGDELAQVIRQDPAYVSIPIVFLSAEADVDRQLAAMRTGGDEFLTKPINLAHLIFAVIARVERYRVLRAFMQRDSLTGLLNHTKSKEFLQSEIARAQRDRYPLSFAMLDIDHFKQVNDTHGHPVGDRVIKGLARLLQQRLRKSDLIGRYGGEEFAVVLPNTPLETACKVLDQLRETFSNIGFIDAGQLFKCTLSGGVVEASSQESAAELILRADEALYAAKHGGRNRIATL